MATARAIKYTEYKKEKRARIEWKELKEKVEMRFGTTDDGVMKKKETD